MAKEEMARTAISRPTAAGLAVALLLLLALGPGLELARAIRGGSRVLQPLATADAAAATREIERRLDEESVLASWCRPRLQSVLLHWLRYGNEKVYAGRGGWLFLRDDFDHLARRRQSSNATHPILDAMVDFERQLAARGIRLLVVPVPSKLAIHPEEFVGTVRGPLAAAGETALLRGLSEHGIEAVDLTPQLVTRAGVDGAAFLRTDSHWTPGAMQDAAREIAMRLREAVDLAEGQRSGAELHRWEISGEGDLRALLELPAAAAETAIGMTAEDFADLTVPQAGAEVLLLGDSFSGIYSLSELGWGAGAGLGEHLAHQLGLPVDRILLNAGGASETRERLASEWQRTPGRFANLRAVVWQFAAREITSGSWRRTALPASGGSDRDINAN